MSAIKRPHFSRKNSKLYSSYENSNYDPHPHLLPEKTEPQVHTWADSHHLDTEMVRVRPEAGGAQLFGGLSTPAPLTQPGRLQGQEGVDRKPSPCQPGRCVSFPPAPLRDVPPVTRSFIQHGFATGNACPAGSQPSERLHFREAKNW